MQLLRVCLRPMMMAIWMKRSIMQPLRWHCRVNVKVRDGAQGRRGAQELGSETLGQTDLLQLPQASQARGLPRVTIDPREKNQGL